MKKLAFLIALVFSLTASAQYGGIEASTGGFSFVPDFTSEDPHFILSVGTNTDKRLQGHLLSLIRAENLVPRNAIFITRYKFLDKRLKATIGTHLPALQISDDYQVDSFFAQELRTDYSIDEKWSLSTMYLHGKGRNNDLEINFGYVGLNYNKGKWNSFSQVWAIDLNNGYGLSQTVSYQIAHKTQLRGFINKTLSTGNTNMTLGVYRAF